MTSSVVFEGNGQIREYVGGYSDWLRQRDSGAKSKSESRSAPKAAAPAPMAAKPKPAKLSYKEQRELEQLPQQIEALETEQAQLNARTSTANFYQSEMREQKRVLDRLQQLDEQLKVAYARWEALEALRDGKA